MILPSIKARTPLALHYELFSASSFSTKTDKMAQTQQTSGKLKVCTGCNTTIIIPDTQIK